MARAGVLLLLIAASCGRPAPAASPEARAIPIVGPDGTQMLHVSCPADEAQCYQLAGRSCPGGYDMAQTHGRSPGRFLVRCRAPAAWQAGVQAAAPAPAPASPAPPPGSAPTAASSATLPGVPPDASQTPQRPLDLGF